MDAVDILKVCFRRWYVMLPILLGAAGVSYQMMETAETTYTAAASYGLVQPGLPPGELEQANPLGPDGSALVGAALEAQLNSRETQARLGSDETRGWGPGDPVNHRSYDVGIPQFETTYEVRAWGEDEEEVQAVVDRVITAAPKIADDAQVRADVPPEQRYRPFVLAETQVDPLPGTSTLKLVIAIMGVGLLMGAAWSIVVDRGLRWRRARRQAVVVADEPPVVTAAEPRVVAAAEPRVVAADEAPVVAARAAPPRRPGPGARRPNVPRPVPSDVGSRQRQRPAGGEDAAAEVEPTPADRR